MALLAGKRKPCEDVGLPPTSSSRYEYQSYYPVFLLYSTAVLVAGSAPFLYLSASTAREGVHPTILCWNHQPHCTILHHTPNIPPSLLSFVAKRI
jgi:hypothetical protein